MPRHGPHPSSGALGKDPIATRWHTAQYIKEPGGINRSRGLEQGGTQFLCRGHTQRILEPNSYLFAFFGKSIEVEALVR